MKTSFQTSRFGVEHRVHAFQRTGRKFVVVSLVTGSGPSKHDVVTVFTAGSTASIIFRVVLDRKRKVKINLACQLRQFLPNSTCVFNFSVDHQCSPSARNCLVSEMLNQIDQKSKENTFLCAFSRILSYLRPLPSPRFSPCLFPLFRIFILRLCSVIKQKRRARNMPAKLCLLF